jgi:hypothetical protein
MDILADRGITIFDYEKSAFTSEPSGIAEFLNPL